MATAKKTTKKTTNTTKKVVVTTDLENALYDLKKEGLEENKDFHVHEYSHAYIDIRFDGFYTQRTPLEFRPDGSQIERDVYGKEVASSG